MSEFHSPYLAMGNNPVSTVDLDGGTTDPEKTYEGNGGKSLNTVTLTAKLLSAAERASSRTGRNINFFAKA